jgi:hypothetical protein
LKNESNLKIARALLRLCWSLTYRTISDFMNAISTPGEFSRDEVRLFSQCLHNLHIYQAIDSGIMNTMTESAVSTITNFEVSQDQEGFSRQFYELTLMFKCFGKKLNKSQKLQAGKHFEMFINRGVLNHDFAFDDGRLAAIHVIDAFYRGEAEIENCAGGLYFKFGKLF